MIARQLRRTSSITARAIVDGEELPLDLFYIHRHVARAFSDVSLASLGREVFRRDVETEANVGANDRQPCAARASTEQSMFSKWDTLTSISPTVCTGA